MKKYIFTLLFIGSLSINAQTVNGINLEDIPARYVILQVKNESTYKIKVLLDYGQMNKLKDEKGFILDGDGNRIKFNSPVSAINFLGERGFKLMSNMLYYTPYYSILFENENYKKTN